MYDNCLYVNKTEKDAPHLLVFVDDLLIQASDKSKINEIKIKRIKTFVITDLGEVEK